MKKTPMLQNNVKITERIFIVLVCLTLLAPFWVFKDLLFPFITSKAYYLRILIELTLPLYAYLLLSNKSYRPNLRNPLNITILAFLLFNILSALAGVNPLKSLWGNFERMGGVFYLAHLVAYYFYVLLLAHIGQNYFKKFFVAVIALGGSMAVYGALVKLQIFTFLPDPSLPRISATLGNPIFFASFLILPMSLTLFYMVQEESRFVQWLLGAVAALELWCIFLSQTRGAIVGLILAIFVSAAMYVVLTPHKKVRMAGGAALLLFVVVMGLAFTQHNKFAQGSLLRRVFNLRDSNTDARLIQWKTALRGFRDRPVLGIGAENYYVVSNQYYNPEIYQYDRSWFDKPHNYFLEILVTTGLLGFIAYAGMLVSVLWIVYKSHRAGLVTLMEFCLLLSGFIAYAIQNLFVFDTISASLMFYVFLGFAAFLWQEQYGRQPDKRTIIAGFDRSFTLTASGIVLLAMVYVAYAGNIAGARVAKAVNYGYAYASVDPQIANKYFQEMKDLPFNFDPIESSGKYSDFAVDAVNALANKNPDLARQILSDAVAFQETAVRRVSNDPTAYQRLSNLYLLQATLAKSPSLAAAQQAIDRALELAPGRPELVMQNARLRIVQNDLPGAMVILQDLVSKIPQNTDAKMQLAVLYWNAGNVQQALDIAQAVLSQGYNPHSAREIDWMAQAYAKQKKFSQAAAILEQAVKLDPGNVADYWQLAQMDAKIGKNQEAITIAQAIAQYDSTRQKEMEVFINSLSK